MDLSLVTRILKLHFVDGLRQKEIADRLGIDKTTVCRHIKTGRENRLLIIQVLPNQEYALGRQLSAALSQFDVREVTVGGSGRSQVAALGAYQFDQWTKKLGDHANVSVVVDGGETIHEWTTLVGGHPLAEVQVVALATDPPSYDKSSVELASRLAARFPSGTTHKLPYFEQERIEKSEFLKQRHDQVEARAANAQYVCLGIGPWAKGFTALELFRHLGWSLDELVDGHGNVKAVCGYTPIDAEGQPVSMPGIERDIRRAVDYSRLQTIAADPDRTVMLMAHGEQKAEAVRAACKARIFNTLVIDEPLARTLLQLVS